MELWFHVETPRIYGFSIVDPLRLGTFFSFIFFSFSLFWLATLRLRCIGQLDGTDGVSRLGVTKEIEVMV